MATKKSSRSTNSKPAAKPAIKPSDKPKRAKPAVRKKQFAEEYVANGGNATKAAKAAGSRAQNLRQAGLQLLTKADTQKLIQEFAAARAAEAGVRAKTVIGVLASQMAADIALVAEADGTFDLANCHARGVSHWIKKYEITDKILKVNITDEGEAGTLIERKTKIELHSAQSAAQTLAKIFGLEQAPRQNDRERIEQLISQYMERRAAKGEVITRGEAIERLAEGSPIFARMLAEIGE